MLQDRKAGLGVRLEELNVKLRQAHLDAGDAESMSGDGVDGDAESMSDDNFSEAESAAGEAGAPLDPNLELDFDLRPEVHSHTLSRCASHAHLRRYKNVRVWERLM